MVARLGISISRCSLSPIGMPCSYAVLGEVTVRGAHTWHELAHAMHLPGMCPPHHHRGHGITTTSHAPHPSHCYVPCLPHTLHHTGPYCTPCTFNLLYPQSLPPESATMTNPGDVHTCGPTCGPHECGKCSADQCTCGSHCEVRVCAASTAKQRPGRADAGCKCFGWQDGSRVGLMSVAQRGQQWGWKGH